MSKLLHSAFLANYHYFTAPREREALFERRAQSPPKAAASFLLLARRRRANKIYSHATRMRAEMIGATWTSSSNWNCSLETRQRSSSL